MQDSSVKAQSQWRFRSLNTGWLIGGGLISGLLVGLSGFLLLEHPGWIGLWLALFLGLGWAGWDVRLRQVGELPAARPQRTMAARPVKDGPFDMVELAGGSFLMGSAEGDAWADKNDWSRESERPQHRVTLSGFRISRIPVTRGQWQDILGQDSRTEGDGELPVKDVNWYQAVDFCNRLSQREGCRPCYRKVGVWRFRRWVCDWSADGYRLPTEAEWEYACRAGTDTVWSYGNEVDELGDFAWYEGNSENKTHPVAQKHPNHWGLYDMHGNVWEWCWDYWYSSYSSTAVVDPRGPNKGSRRVLRGGSFRNSPENLRSASRVSDDPEFRDWDIGFRCVRVPARQH